MMSYVNHVTVIVVEKLFNTSYSINITWAPFSITFCSDIFVYMYLWQIQTLR